jgi:ribose 5-phosphate isomerase RpiB
MQGMKWPILALIELNLRDDYPDYVTPLARAVVSGHVDRGVAICGSGVGASCQSDLPASRGLRPAYFAGNPVSCR